MANLKDINYGVGKYLVAADASSLPDIATNRNNLGLLNFKVATNNSYALYSFKDGMIDAYMSEAGVDTSASTNETYNAAGDYYSGSGTTTETYDAYINGYCASSGASGGHIPTFSTTNNRRVSFGQSTGTSSFISANVTDKNSGIFTLDMTIVQKGGGNGPFCAAPGVVKDTCSSTSGWPPTSAYGAYNTTSASNVSDVLKLVYDTDDPNVMTTYKNGAAETTTRDNTGSNWLSIGTPTTLYFLFPCWSDNATPWIWTIAGTRSSTVANATGNYTSTTETASSTVSKMGIVILYKNASGTATLDTDLVAQVSANGGTNYTSAPLTAAGTFSTGINIAVANDITISNTGTTPKYKISFANQALTTKETQVHGVALLY